MQYSVVLSAALKADTCPASHLSGPGSIAGGSFETCGGKSGTGSVLADFDCTLPIIIPSMLHIRSYCPAMDNVLISGSSSTQMLSHPTIRITLCYAWLTVILR